MKSSLVRLDLGLTKVYLIPCNNGYLLIDTGYKNDYSKFKDLLAKKDIGIQRIKYLLLTHHHNDHVGFAQLLKEEFGVRLIVQEKAIPLLAKGYNCLSEVGAPVNGLVGGIMKLFSLFQKDLTYQPVIIDERDMVIYGDDQEFLPSLGIKGKIILTPGHTSDSISLLMDNGDVFCGDLAMNFIMLAGTRHRPILIKDQGQVSESWAKLIESGAKTIYPAHGNPFSAKKLESQLKLAI